jgi:magnesium-transporting ATPase (P-type)
MITSNDNINDNTLKMITYMITQNMSKCYHFSGSAIVIIFILSFSLVHILCYHLCYLFRVLSFMLSSNNNRNDDTKYVQGKGIT